MKLSQRFLINNGILCSFDFLFIILFLSLFLINSRNNIGKWIVDYFCSDDFRWVVRSVFLLVDIISRTRKVHSRRDCIWKFWFYQLTRSQSRSLNLIWNIEKNHIGLFKNSNIYLDRIPKEHLKIDQNISKSCRISQTKNMF